jgi:hypothetical protein
MSPVGAVFLQHIDGEPVIVLLPPPNTFYASFQYLFRGYSSIFYEVREALVTTLEGIGTSDRRHSDG